jgi:hypothetical protein
MDMMINHKDCDLYIATKLETTHQLFVVILDKDLNSKYSVQITPNYNQDQEYGWLLFYKT